MQLHGSGVESRPGAILITLFNNPAGRSPAGHLPASTEEENDGNYHRGIQTRDRQARPQDRARDRQDQHKIELEIGKINHKIEHEIGKINHKIDLADLEFDLVLSTEIAGVKEDLGQKIADAQIKITQWMVGAFIGSTMLIGTIIGVYLAVILPLR